MGLDDVNIVVLADVHQGHTNIDPYVAHNNLMEYVIPQLNKDLDLLIINGDFFDTLLTLSSKAGYMAIRIISTILELSVRHRFLIRVIRGTYSHDRDQCMFFQSDKLNNVKYITNLEIEYIEKLKMHLIYIPDDLLVDKRVEITELLEINRLKKVDLVCSHGYLTHLVPTGVTHLMSSALSSAWISSKCEFLVNGHVHNYSIHDNLISIGSFERMIHGNERPVGFCRIDYNTKTKVWKPHFIENKSATLFKTYTENTDCDTGHFKKWLNALPASSVPIHVCVVCKRPTEYRQIVADAIQRFVFSSKPKKTNKEAVTINVHRHIPTLKLSEDNIIEAIIKEMPAEGRLTKERINKLLAR